MDNSTQNHRSRYRIVAFLKADQTCLQVCCSTPQENPNPSFSTKNGKIFLCSNRNKAKPVAFIDIPRIPSINVRSKQLCPLIYDGLKRASIDFTLLELCASSIFDEELKIFQRRDFFMQIIDVSTLDKVE